MRFIHDAPPETVAEDLDTGVSLLGRPSEPDLVPHSPIEPLASDVAVPANIGAL